MKKSEKIISVIKNLLGHTGFYFTLIVMFLIVSLKVAFPAGNKVVETNTYGWILLFAAIYAACNFVLKIKFIDSYIAKLSIHYVLIVLDFAIVMAWLSGVASNSKQILFVTIAFAFVYIVIEAIRAAFYFKTHRKSNEEENYQTLFSGKK